jgi:putative endonuclease
MSCYCYIVECADGTYYTGWAVDPVKRVAIHNKGRGARYTRTRAPVKLVYVEELPDRKSAMKREIAIKRLTRDRKGKLINEAGSRYEVKEKTLRE